MKRLFYVGIPVLVLGGLIGWRVVAKNRAQAEQNGAAQARKNAPPGVRITTAVQRDIVHVFEGIGSAESPFNVRVSSQVTGRITYLEVREGAHVQRGDILVRVDPSEIQAQVNQQQANLAEAQSRLAQAALTTNATNVSITSQVQQQQAVVNSARSNLNQTEKNYDSQVASARATVTDAQGRIDNAAAAIHTADASIQSSQANLNNAQARYNRTDTLYKQGFIAAQDLDDARTQVQVQESGLLVARGQRDSAQAAYNSAVAQKRSAQEQLDIAIVKGKADIDAARASLEQANATLATARANIAQKPAYLQNLAALRAAVNATAAQLRNAQVQLSQTLLRSPVTGYVTARYMDPGMVAGVGQQVLALQTVREIYVTTSVPEDITRGITPGIAATCVFDSLPGQTFIGRVTQINPAIDPTSRQFVVRITLDNPRNLIRPGMFARVIIEIQRTRNVVVVPREAVGSGKKGTTVTVVDANDTAHIRPVQTGDNDAEGIAVTRGVQPGERIVILALTPVKDGQKVRVGEIQPAGRGRPDVKSAGGGAPASSASAASAAGAGTSGSGASQGQNTQVSPVSDSSIQTGPAGLQTPITTPGKTTGSSPSGTSPPTLGPINPPIQVPLPGAASGPAPANSQSGAASGSSTSGTSSSGTSSGTGR